MGRVPAGVRVLLLAAPVLLAACEDGRPAPAPLWRGACHFMRGQLGDGSFDGSANLVIEDIGDEAVIRLLTTDAGDATVETAIRMSEADLRAGARGEPVLDPAASVEGRAGPSYGEWTIEAIVESPAVTFEPYTVEPYDGQIVLVDLSGAWDVGGDVAASFWVRPPWGPE